MRQWLLWAWTWHVEWIWWWQCLQISQSKWSRGRICAAVGCTSPYPSKASSQAKEVQMGKLLGPGSGSGGDSPETCRAVSVAVPTAGVLHIAEGQLQWRWARGEEDKKEFEISWGLHRLNVSQRQITLPHKVIYGAAWYSWPPTTVSQSVPLLEDT